MRQTLDLDAVEQALGIRVVSRSGEEDIARCPLPSHTGGDSNPSFGINRDKLLFNCYACGVGGTIPTLVQQMEGIDEWQEALDWLAPYVEGGVREDPNKFTQHIKRILYLDEEDTPATMPYFNPKVLEAWTDGPFDYWAERGISEITARKLRLGYATQYTKFNPKTHTEWVGEAAIIPHFFEGNLVGYQARIVGDKPLGLPRFDNTSGFPKADTLYNWDRARGVSQSPVYVVESAITAAYLWELGKVAVATFGAEVSDTQIQLLRGFPKIVLSCDNDRAGELATRRLIKALSRHTVVAVLPPIDGEKADLNDLQPTHALDHMGLEIPAALYDYYTKE